MAALRIQQGAQPTTAQHSMPSMPSAPQHRVQVGALSGQQRAQRACVERRKVLSFCVPVVLLCRRKTGAGKGANA